MSDINITGTVSTSQDYTNSYRNQMQESLIDAINILYKGAVAKENISKTLECVISDASERDKGIYKVDYMKNIFEVSCPLSTVYDVGDAVFVLVPDGDFSKTKIIVGSAEGNTGGSSGADVEANPAGTATDTLEKLRVGTTIYSIEGGPADAVTDVKVNGTSVVGPDHVARVSAVTQAQLENVLETKADANDLSALEGTVSDLTTTVNGKASQSSLEALATIVGTKANAADVNAALNLKADQSDLSDLITVVNGKANISDIPEIEANPSDTATDTLTKIDIDGTVYDLAGGTTVIANPSGSATDELEKVQIGNTIYSLPSGGGTIETIIPTTEHATSERNSTSQDTYTATDDMYAIAVNLSINGEASSYTQTCNITTDGEVLDAVTNHQDTQSSPNRNYAIAVDSLNLTSGDDIDFINTGTATYIVRLRGVVGLNQEVRIKNEIDNLIVSDNTNNSRTVTLLPDKVYMVLAFGTSGNGGTAGDINVTSTGTMTFTTLSAQSAKMVCAFIVEGNSVTISFGNDSNYYSKGHIIYEVDVKKVEYATKEDLENYVVANPEDTPTDDISSIKIGDTVYGISSGGSSTNYGKFTYDLLLENDPLPSYQNANNGVNRTYTLSKSIDDYDAVYVISCTDYNSSQTLAGCTDRLILKNNYYDSSHVLSGSYTDGRLMYITFDDNTTVSTSAWGNAGYCPVLYKVYGVRFENKLINRSDIYSEEERMIGRWTDGKPLYQKTIIYSTPFNIANGSWYTSTETYSNMNLVNAVIVNSSFATYTGSIVVIENNHLVIGNQTHNQPMNNIKYITIQYTKTTDTPGSGVIPEDPMFISDPMIYSEEEQVVGSWTDGKPLYQKTIIWDNPTLGRVDDLPHGINNVDHIHILWWKAGIITGIDNTDSNYWADVWICSDTAIHYRLGPSWGEAIKPLIVTFQYTKTTDSVLSGPTKGKIVQRSDIYSEEERLIGRWTDGKPLYQKTIKNIGVTLQQNTWTNTGIPFSGIDHWEVIFNKSNSSTYDNQYPMLYRFYDGNFQAFCQYTMPLDELTLQYTKTTDAPFSKQLIEDPQFVMMSDIYSEEEQIVGRWTDGKPIYQKVIRGNFNGAYNTTVSVPYDDISYNIEYIVKQEGYARYEYDNTPTSSSWFKADHTVPNNINFIVGDVAGNRILTLYLDNPSWAKMYDYYVIIQYTKTTDAPGTGPTKGNLIYLPALYSEEEREVGVWTDGKPLYQKTWHVGAISAGSNVRVSMPTGIDKVIDISGNAHSSNYSQWVKINFPHQNISAYIVTAAYLESSNEVNIYSGTDYVLDECNLTLQYTKTTDQPGSGTFLTDGTPSHHYSTSEKVVGTWIDGSTLYEKTINFGSLPNNTTKTVSSGLSNISVQQIFGVAKASNGFTVTLPHREISGSGNIDMIYQADNYIRIITDYDYSGYTACITLQYTKSS